MIADCTETTHIVVRRNGDGCFGIRVLHISLRCTIATIRRSSSINLTTGLGNRHRYSVCTDNLIEVLATLLVSVQQECQLTGGHITFFNLGKTLVRHTAVVQEVAVGGDNLTGVTRHQLGVASCIDKVTQEGNIYHGTVSSTPATDTSQTLCTINTLNGTGIDRIFYSVVGFTYTNQTAGGIVTRVSGIDVDIRIYILNNRRTVTCMGGNRTSILSVSRNRTVHNDVLERTGELRDE